MRALKRVGFWTRKYTIGWTEALEGSRNFVSHYCNHWFSNMLGSDPSHSQSGLSDWEWQLRLRKGLKPRYIRVSRKLRNYYLRYTHFNVFNQRHDTYFIFIAFLFDDILYTGKLNNVSGYCSDLDGRWLPVHLAFGVPLLFPARPRNSGLAGLWMGYFFCCSCWVGRCRMQVNRLLILDFIITKS